MTTALTITSPHAPSLRNDALVVLDEYLADLKLQVESGQLAPTTAITYRLGIGRFVDYAVSAGRIDTAILQEWVIQLRKKNYTPSTVNTWLAGVRAFLAWAVAHQLIPYNPARDIKGARRDNRAKHLRAPLSDAEVVAVLSIPGDSDQAVRDRAYLTLRAYTAVRDIELHRADLADLKTRGERTVLFIQGKGHVSKDDFVVLNEDAQRALRDWLRVRGNRAGPLFTSLSNKSRGSCLSLRAIRDLVKSAYRAAGVIGDDKTSHSLRHSAITNAIEHGAPIEKAKSMARHRDISTTAIYYHTTTRLREPAEDFIHYEKIKTRARRGRE